MILAVLRRQAASWATCPNAQLCLTLYCALPAGGSCVAQETTCPDAPLHLTLFTALCKQRAAVWHGGCLPQHVTSSHPTSHTASCRREAGVRLRVLNEKTKTDPCPNGERCTDQAACKYYHTKLDQMPKIFFKERYCRIWQVSGAAGHPPAELAGSTGAQSTSYLTYDSRNWQLPKKLGSRPVDTHTRSPPLS